MHGSIVWTMRARDRFSSETPIQGARFKAVLSADNCPAKQRFRHDWPGVGLSDRLCSSDSWSNLTTSVSGMCVYIYI